MNAPGRFSASDVPITVSADGLVRRAFTVADVVKMVEVGIIDPDERLEIVGGEILPMSPKGNRHEAVKRRLNRFLSAHLPATLDFVAEAGWRLNQGMYLEPDFIVFRAELELDQVTGSDAALLVEISDSSLDWDLGRKAQLYADEGVAEYWVVDAATRTTHVHLMPAAGGYGSVRAYAPDVMLEPRQIRGLKLRLADLPPT